MAFDGVVTKALVADFQNKLIGARVNKVFQPSKSEIILNLYNKSNYMLDICIHPDYYRICFTEHSKPNPTNALNFCMLLRKYLTGSKITAINSFDLDRIICIDFEGSNELKDTLNFHLIIELMGRRSNIILLNDKNYIIDAVKHIITADHEILPAREYVRPAVTKNSFLELDNFGEFYTIISQEYYDDLIKHLCSVFTGFSASFVSNVLEELDIDSSTKDVNELEEIYNYIKDLISQLGTENVSFKELQKDYTIELANSSTAINSFIDDFYYNKEIDDIFTNAKSNLSKLILAGLKKDFKKIRKY